MRASTNGQPLVISASGNVTADDRLRYFKGERWGIAALYKSCEKKRRTTSSSTVAKRVRRATAKAEQGDHSNDAGLEFAHNFLMRMQAGPDWCREVVDEHVVFLRDDMLGSLKSLLPYLEEQTEKQPNTSESSD
jgi:hypothetical protein